MSNIQFNFELPEEEANRLLDVGVERKMGLSRSTVQKSMIARALTMERLDQIAPVGASVSLPALADLLAKITTVIAIKPEVKGDIEKLLRGTRRTARKAA